MKIKLYLGVVILIVALSSLLFAQGMSELNVREFQKETKVTETGAIRNPFVAKQPLLHDLTVEDLFLNGVVVGPGKSYALINGHALGLGESIAGLRVKSIGKSKVILQHLDRFHILYLEGGY